jgi:hypothetical protein
MEVSMEDLDEKMAAGDTLMRQALHALRRYNEAKGVLSNEEIECLRLETEALMTAVSECQFRALGGPAPSLH